jgi:transposase-like protein
MPRPFPYVIELSPEERTVLEKRAQDHHAGHTTVIRARIVLLSAAGHENTVIAAHLGVRVNVVRTWRRRFSESGLRGLVDRPRPGQPLSLPADVAEATPREVAAQAVVGDPAAQMTGPLAIHRPKRVHGRPARGSPCPNPSSAASMGQLLPFRPHTSATTARDALCQLVRSINRYLGETDAGPSRGVEVGLDYIGDLVDDAGDPKHRVSAGPPHARGAHRT